MKGGAVHWYTYPKQNEKKWLPDSIHNLECLTNNATRLVVHATQNIHMLQDQYTKGKLQIVTITGITSFQ